MRFPIPILLASALLALAPPAPAQTDAFPGLEAERLEQSGTVITIIFDDSSSMRGNKLDEAKRAFRDWLSTVPDNHRIGLISLNQGQLVASERGNKSEVADTVARIQAVGTTPLADAIDLANEEIAKRKASRPFERQVLVVLTDGEDSTARGAAGVQDELQAAAREGTETVGIGFFGEGDYMSSAATRYFDAANSEELRAGLAKVDAEIGDTSDIVISPEIAEAMKTVSLADLRPTAPANSNARADNSASPNSTTSTNDGPPFTWIIILVIAYGVYRVFFRRK